MPIYDMAYISKISVEQIGKNFNIEKFSDGFYYRVVVWKNRVFENSETISTRAMKTNSFSFVTLL